MEPRRPKACEVTSNQSLQAKIIGVDSKNAVDIPSYVREFKVIGLLGFDS